MRSKKKRMIEEDLDEWGNSSLKKRERKSKNMQEKETIRS